MRFFLTPTLLVTTVSAAVTSGTLSQGATADWSQLQYLVNYNAVLQTINSYPSLYDLGNYPALGDLYTSDGCARFPILNNTSACGPAAIAKYMEAGSKQQGTGATLKTQHSFTNPDITFDNQGTAHAVVYLSEAIYEQYQPKMVTAAHGWYNMTLVKTQDGPHFPQLQWKIQDSLFEIFVSCKIRQCERC